MVVKRDKEQEKRNNKCISEVLSTKYCWDNSQTPYQKYPRDNGERHTRGKKNQVSIIIFYFLNKSLGRIPWLECISTKYTKMRKCRSSFNPKEHAKLLNTTTQGLSRRWWNYTIPWHIAIKSVVLNFDQNAYENKIIARSALKPAYQVKEIVYNHPQ